MTPWKLHHRDPCHFSSYIYSKTSQDHLQREEQKGASGDSPMTHSINVHSPIIISTNLAVIVLFCSIGCHGYRAKISVLTWQWDSHIMSRRKFCAIVKKTENRRRVDLVLSPCLGEVRVCLWSLVKSTHLCTELANINHASWYQDGSHPQQAWPWPSCLVSCSYFFPFQEFSHSFSGSMASERMLVVSCPEFPDVRLCSRC